MPRVREISSRHKARLKAEKRFKYYGIAALSTACIILMVILASLFMQGYQGFWHTQVKITAHVMPEYLEMLPDDTVADIPPSSYQLVIKQALLERFPETQGRIQRRQLGKLVSSYAGLRIKKKLDKNPKLLGKKMEVWVNASSLTDLFYKGVIKEETPEAERSMSDRQIAWFKALQEDGAVRSVFNTEFFSNGDSRTPERAGFLGAMVGTMLTMLCCLTIVFPIGVMTAVYLEEFAKRSWFTDWVEVNINNLAAVPSIVFGLLGLAVYISVMGLPRSAPIVGGLTLAMMILPVIIISTRVAIEAIPRAIRDAARGLGATPVQVVWHHVLPLAMPGIMTGTILGLARAIGETAPLIMIGMVAFIADIPENILDSATVMPVQVYLWASSPEAGFAEKTAAGILVLLVILLTLNALAIYLRKRFEVRW